MNLVGAFPCTGLARTLPPPELGSIRELVKQLQVQFEVVEAWAQRVCSSNGGCPVDTDDLLCKPSSNLPVGVSLTASPNANDAIPTLICDTEPPGPEPEPPPLQEKLPVLMDVEAGGMQKGHGTGSNTFVGFEGGCNSQESVHLEHILPKAARVSLNTSDSWDANFITSERNLASSPTLLENVNETTRHISELRLWYDRLLAESSSGTYLSPDSIRHFIIESEGESARDVRWISSVIQEYNDASAGGPGFSGRASCADQDDDVRSAIDEAVQRAKKMSMMVPGRRTISIRTSQKLAVEEKPADHLDFYGFIELITWKGIDVKLSSSQKEEVLEIREALIKHSVDQLVYEMSHLRPAKHKPPVSLTSKLVHNLLEPVIGSIVFINALTIGISSDSTWSAWAYFEMFFTIFFLFEVVVKIGIFGCREHFMGPDKSWNIFDFVVVSFAVVDVIFEHILQTDNDLNNFTMVRLARLAKITRLIRLVRLLRLKFFRELLLMIKGVIAGMRTLVWAFVLLVSLVYIVGVLLRQTMGEDRRQMDDKYNTILFNSVPWSMFTVFRCLSADCVLSDGTPLVSHLFQFYGYSFVFGYALIFLFVNFGIFNLIMAVFVENVMESARVKRQLHHEEERARVCRKLRALVMCFGGQTERSSIRNTNQGAFRASEKPLLPWEGESNDGERKSFSAQLMSRVRTLSTFNLSGAVSKRLSGIRKSCSSTATQHRTPTDVQFQFGGQISREMFQEVIMTNEVQELMDDLEIHVCDRSELFDVLDADGSGMVDVSELINGLLKLRSGGADKSDMVAAILGIRSIQKQLQEMMLAVYDQKEMTLLQDEQFSTFLKKLPRQVASTLQGFTGDQLKSSPQKFPLRKLGQSADRLSL